MLEYLTIGELVGVHGIKGELKVFPTTKDVKRYDALDYVYVDDGKDLLQYDVEYVKYVKNLVIIKLKGVDSRTQAEALTGFLLKVDRANAIPLGENEYFICDLIGLKVFNIKDDKYIGVLKDVISTGKNDVYVVETDKDDVLIPAIKQSVKEIDIKKGMISVEI